ncbi:MAG: hypothetical protein GEU74_14535 [Nitriliruptorales bacterium]|nr:hypothetical protein [Nitriliruptorales bacterium]
MATATLVTWALTQPRIEQTVEPSTTAIIDQVSPSAADYYDKLGVTPPTRGRLAPNAADYYDQRRGRTPSSMVSPNATDYRDKQRGQAATSEWMSPNAADHGDKQRASVSPHLPRREPR